jgi:hypothetical protein
MECYEQETQHRRGGWGVITNAHQSIFWRDNTVLR